MRFLDTNVLLRYLTRDDEKQAQAALNLLKKLEQGEERVHCSTMVIFEVIYTLQSFYHLSKKEVHELVLPILHLRGLHLESPALLHQALALYVDKNLSFTDAYLASEMILGGEKEIYTWDHDFEKIKGIKRIEPQ